MPLFHLIQASFFLSAFINGSGIHPIQAFSNVTIALVFGTLLPLSIFQTFKPCLPGASMGNHEQAGAQNYDKGSEEKNPIESIFQGVTSGFWPVFAAVLKLVYGLCT